MFNDIWNFLKKVVATIGPMTHSDRCPKVGQALWYLSVESASAGSLVEFCML